MGTHLFTPFGNGVITENLDAEGRVHMELTSEEHEKIERGHPWSAIVTDQRTRRRYLVRGAPCGENCFCDAQIIREESPPAKTLAEFHVKQRGLLNLYKVECEEIVPNTCGPQKSMIQIVAESEHQALSIFSTVCPSPQFSFVCCSLVHRNIADKYSTAQGGETTDARRDLREAVREVAVYCSKCGFGFSHGHCPRCGPLMSVVPSPTAEQMARMFQKGRTSREEGRGSVP